MGLGAYFEPAGLSEAVSEQVRVLDSRIENCRSVSQDRRMSTSKSEQVRDRRYRSLPRFVIKTHSANTESLEAVMVKETERFAYNLHDEKARRNHYQSQWMRLSDLASTAELSPKKEAQIAKLYSAMNKKLSQRFKRVLEDKQIPSERSRWRRLMEVRLRTTSEADRIFKRLLDPEQRLIANELNFEFMNMLSYPNMTLFRAFMNKMITVKG